MKRTLILMALLLVDGLTAMAQLKEKATARELRELVNPGTRSL